MTDPGFTVTDADEPAPDDGDDGDKKPKRPRVRDRIATLLSGCEFWLCAAGEPHVSLYMPTHLEHCRVRSALFAAWLQARHSQEHGAGLSGTALQDAQGLALGRCFAGGEVRPVWRRVAAHGGDIFLDLGGYAHAGERRAVHVSAAGWRLVGPRSVPVMFLRGKDARALPEPARGGAVISDLQRFVALDGVDDLVLAWAWLVCALRPAESESEYPILLVHGEQGSGKSFAARVLADLVDPSELRGRGLPREEREISISAANRHLAAYDNLSSVGDGYADAFCRLATGAGYAARQLHSDTDEVFITGARPLLLNGIPSALTGRADLGDRTLAIELHPPRERQDRGDLQGEFVRLQPALLGLLLDGVAAALRRLPGTVLADPPRMMASARWAEAAAEGLGITDGLMVTAWRDNRASADAALLATDSLAGAVIKLMDEHPAGWRGSPRELHRALEDLVDERTRKARSWPATEAGMATRLKRLAPVLRSAARIDFIRGKSGDRWMSLSRRP